MKRKDLYVVDALYVKKEKPFSCLVDATMFAFEKAGDVETVGYIYKVTYYEAE